MKRRWIFLVWILIFPLVSYADDFYLGGSEGGDSRQSALNTMFAQVDKQYPRYLDQIFHQSADPVVGNPNGSITLVEFIDYQCPYCIKMAPVVDNLIRANANLRVVFKEFPIRGPMSQLAAKMALAAKKQGKYYAFHRAVMGLHRSLTESVLFSTAKTVGLDINQLKTDLNSPDVTALLKSQHQLAQNLGLRGTPTFFIGKTNGTSANTTRILFGEHTQSSLQKVIANR